MSGFAGLVALNEPNHISEYLSVFLRSIQLHQNEKLAQFTSGSSGMVTASSQTMAAPTLARQGNLVLGWFGNIVPDHHLKDRLARILTHEPDLSQTIEMQLLTLYRNYGARALHALNGQYIVIIWDDDQQTLKIVNDRYGLQPFYYWHNRDQFVYASTMKAITRHPGFRGQVSPVALFDLLATGQMLGERTLFQEIHALPPATELTYSGGQLTLVGYWQPALYQPGERTVPTSQTVDQFGDMIYTAVSRHTSPENSCLLLTGGLDSRWLAGSLVSLYGKDHFLANTIGHGQSLDTLLAARIAATTGLDHQVIPVNPYYLSDYANECVRRTEGNMNCTAGWILGESSFLHRHRVRAVITGVGAELITGRHWLAEQPDLDPKLAVHHLSTRYWHFLHAARLMRSQYQMEVQNASIGLLQSCLRAAPSTDPISQYDYLHLIQHRRHPTGNILSADVVVQEPFHDNDLVDFAFRIPPHLRAFIYKKALANCYPRLARIETTEGGVSIVDDLNARRNHAHQIKRFFFRAVRKLGVSRAVGLPQGDPPWNTIYPNHWMRTTSRSYITQLSKKVELLEPWVDVPLAQGLIADHLEGRIHAYARIGALLTAVLWLEQMI